MGFVELFDSVGFTSWLNREALLAKIDGLVDEAADDENALSDGDGKSRSSSSGKAARG